MSFTLITGPMFAGKSTYLLNEIKRIKNAKEEVLVICHSADDRYGKGLISHNGDSYNDVISCASFEEAFTKHRLKLLTFRNIIIDELQFFPDAYFNIVNLVDNLKTNVIAGGLSGDFERKPMGDIEKLSAFADYRINIYANCRICGNMAPFSRRICESKETFLPGGSDKYIPTCRKCYLLDKNQIIELMCNNVSC